FLFMFSNRKHVFGLFFYLKKLSSYVPFMHSFIITKKATYTHAQSNIFFHVKCWITYPKNQKGY
ncbi:hypothetical protein, partial [Bacillus paranthracis]|uniref:hypothetical protein n=1 Tax=Bacillus paranthracis TaxID=2026186 RepID=UPI00399FAE33